MEINKERLLLGIDALNSGEYRQTQGTLKFTVAGVSFYCCLGVLCEVAKDNGCEVDETDFPGGYSHFDGQCNVLPESVGEWYGFDDANPGLIKYTNCINANDVVGVPFGEIARVLKETYIDEPGQEADSVP